MMTVASDSAEGDYIDLCHPMVSTALRACLPQSKFIYMCVSAFMGACQNESLLDRQFGDKFVKGLKELSLLLPPISCLARGIHGN